MTSHTVIVIVAAVLILVVAGVGGYSYMEERVARASLEAKLTVYETQLAAIDQGMKTRQQATETAVRQAKAQAAKVKTPAQAIPALDALVSLPRPIVMPLPTVEMPRPDATIPYDSILPLFQRLEGCKESEILLGQCQVDRSDLTKKAEILEKSRDEAVATVKGGTFWQRLVRNSKYVLIGAAAGAGAYAAATH